MKDNKLRDVIGLVSDSIKRHLESHDDQAQELASSTAELEKRIGDLEARYRALMSSLRTLDE